MTKVADTPSTEDESTSGLGDEHEEQSQFLLEKVSQEPNKGDPRYRTRASKVFLVFCLASFLVFFVLLAVILSSISIQIPHEGVQISNHVTSNAQSYVLDSGWDYLAPPTIREYDWIVTDEIYNPDGVFRPMMLINRQFPGPLIECNDGDTIVVHVNNKAENATSIHWHGLFQQGTPWMDGTVGISQCPIAPGSSFTYEFKIQDQWGSYWWHSHQAVQIADGLFGPFIVHAPNERTELRKLGYASDRILMVQDYYHDSSTELLLQYLASDRENAEPVPEGALINGKNIRDCSSLPRTRHCDNTTANVGRPVIDLELNQRHRLRIINTGVFAELQIQLDEHEFAVTEADGTAVEPAYFHRLNINPAQRYSIVVDAHHTDSASQFWLRARMVTACFAEENPELDPEIRGIVQYHATSSSSGQDSSSPSTAAPDHSSALDLPTSLDWPEIIELQCHDLNTSLLHPISIPAISVPFPSSTDATIHLRANFEIGAWRLSRGFFNSSSWLTDVASPTLHRAIDGLLDGNASFTVAPMLSTKTDSPPSEDGIGISQAFDTTSALTLSTPLNKTIDLVISNFDDGAHPFHLHGHKFWVLDEGSGYPPSSGSSLPELKDPLRRDTATIPAFGWIWLRFRADNVGLWAFHCHVSWHAEAGLMMQVLVGCDANGNGELKDLQIPERNRALCKAPKEVLEKGARPVDESWFGFPAE